MSSFTRHVISLPASIQLLFMCSVDCSNVDLVSVLSRLCLLWAVAVYVDEVIAVLCVLLFFHSYYCRRVQDRCRNVWNVCRFVYSVSTLPTHRLVVVKLHWAASVKYHFSQISLELCPLKQSWYAQFTSHPDRLVTPTGGATFWMTQKSSVLQLLQ